MFHLAEMMAAFAEIEIASFPYSFSIILQQKATQQQQKKPKLLLSWIEWFLWTNNGKLTCCKQHSYESMCQPEWVGEISQGSKPS